MLPHVTHRLNARFQYVAALAAEEEHIERSPANSPAHTVESFDMPSMPNHTARV